MTPQILKGSIFLDPEKILHQADLRYGQKIADFGCGGSGHFVLQAARVVGDKGVVYAVDVLRSSLSGAESKARLYGLINIIPVWSDVEIVGAAKRIKDGSLDVVLLIQLLFQSKKHDNIFKETARVLKKGGSVIVVDWQKCDLSVGPEPDDYVSEEMIKEIAQRNNFKYLKSFKVGPYHYGLIFKKG